MRLRHQLGVSRLQEPGRLPPVESRATALDFADGLPEIRKVDLDPAVAHFAIESHGSLIVRDMVTDAEAERLRAVIDESFTAFDTVLGGGESHDTWYSPFSDANEISRGWLRFKGGVSLADSPRATFDVAEEFHAAGIGTFADQFLGEPAIISLDKTTLRRGGADMGIEWHQDGSFLGTEVRALNVWLALSDCGVDAPSLDVVPFRLDEIVDTGTEGAGYGWSVSDDVAQRAAGDPGWRRPTFRAGDALLFDEMMLHRTGADPNMPDTRYAIEMWFFGPSADTQWVEIPFVL